MALTAECQRSISTITGIPSLSRHITKEVIRLAIPILLLSACSKSDTLPVPGSISEYMPLQTGSLVTYRLDSTIYPKFSQQPIVKTYIIQDRVDAEVRDLLGRKSYRIIRSIRNNTDTTKWSGLQVLMATPTDLTLEWVHNNLRTVSLALPIKEGFTWQGNRYINTTTDNQLQYLDGWEFRYRDAGKPFSTGSSQFPETITVEQRNETIGAANDKSRYFSNDRSVEVYAKGVGLVYKDFLHVVWQPPNASSPTGYYESNSMGIRLSFLTKN